MKFTNNLILLALSLSFIGCGGGGGNSEPSIGASATDNPTQPTPTPTPTPAATTDPNAVYDTTADLVVAKSFLMEQEYDLTIEYADTSNRAAYLSICSEFTQVQLKVSVNYDSCILRTTSNSSYKNIINIPNDKKQLVMAIWYLDDLNNPRYEFWNNDETTSQAKVFSVNL